MRIESPQASHIPALRVLWQEAFGDEDRFLNDFFTLAFSPTRSRCVFDGTQPVAALYWFDEICREKPMAYLYGVATRRDYRNRGLCRALIADTHRLLAVGGYAGVLLRPASPALAQAYSTMGYKNATTVSRITCTAGTAAIPLCRVNPEEYLRLRNRLLPEGSAMLSESHLPFLETQAFFYGGTDFVLAATVEGNNLTGTELLGNPAVAPGILAALGIPHGEFLTPGGETDYAMFCCLDGQTPPPDYFGLAFE